VKLLFLLRHAKSSWADSGLSDRKRPLAPRGRRAARNLARYMQQEHIRPALVLCSSARRTRETVELLAPALGGVKVRVEDELYAASAAALLRRLRRVPARVPSVMVVGHNPGIQDLALALAARGDALASVQEKLPTGALASLAFRKTWAALGKGDAELVGLVAPRDLA
jgi:phosphohistidine phosphatase